MDKLRSIYKVPSCTYRCSLIYRHHHVLGSGDVMAWVEEDKKGRTKRNSEASGLMGLISLGGKTYMNERHK